MRVRRLIESAEFHVDGLLRTNNVVTDWRSYSGFNAGYGANVSDPYPPRTTVLGQLLDPVLSSRSKASRIGTATPQPLFRQLVSGEPA
jgi:hypothetical protein